MPPTKKAKVLPHFTHLRVRMDAVSLGWEQYNKGDVVDITQVRIEDGPGIGQRQLEGITNVLERNGNNYPTLEAGNVDDDGKFYPVEMKDVALVRTAEERETYSPLAQKLAIDGDVESPPMLTESAPPEE